MEQARVTLWRTGRERLLWLLHTMEKAITDCKLTQVSRCKGLIDSHYFLSNPGFPTVEGELVRGLLEAGVIPQDHHDNIWKMSFQRAARTDKGVSAAGNVCSLKMCVNVENLVDKINEKLPDQIRVMDVIRTTKGFNAKNHCSGRTYIYLIPTLAFSSVEETVTLEYRTTLDIIERVNEVLQKFKGTHNFHNFTSGIKPEDGSARRYIWNFECGLPFVRDGVEFCVLSVSGQSFMLHQIRKMIGLTIAIVRGFADIESIDNAWESEKMDIPKAPSLGLMLDKLHYNQYNEKFCKDGSHDKIDFSTIKDKLKIFKDEQIFPNIIKTEIEEHSMLQWLSTLHLHTCLAIDTRLCTRRKFMKNLEEDCKGAQADDTFQEGIDTAASKEVDQSATEPLATKDTTEGASDEVKRDTCIRTSPPTHEVNPDVAKLLAEKGSVNEDVNLDPVTNGADTVKNTVEKSSEEEPEMRKRHENVLP
ncbi:pseudouridylate synthase 1 homolog isoform X2 [Dreissena polymorpha]|uniref:pseudouridylate synthase 1 homolog isoform X2 n=1 Tax=Dreissena polymorpha TaxID=45954 RepID=UPI0022647A18|nr:pseudouridylate synthase 1 homolog isoform X2 [Dreissena polymorpha]XP_052227490.1 pseudouridylate synthase 1 homolog isoform X2 [Dreissena polymorpha]